MSAPADIADAIAYLGQLADAAEEMCDHAVSCPEASHAAVRMVSGIGCLRRSVDMLRKDLQVAPGRHEARVLRYATKLREAMRTDDIPLTHPPSSRVHDALCDLCAAVDGVEEYFEDRAEEANDGGAP